MAILKCKMCGGDVELSADRTFGTCESCGCTMTFPKVDDEQRANRFNRGNQFRRSGEFDKALTLYERLVQEDENDAEAHWCCALCRFGIEYVEDPNTLEYLPTCHRASFDSFLEDVDYLAAVEHSDGITRRQYQKDAQKIAEVQRGILATSQNEEPFDVFICYKESEDDGSRTRDSLYAQEIYYQLTEQGRRVFFSRITLEDKAGTEYEPYIFAALNSAKVMILVTTSAEHANAVWVKNEWSRFLSLMRKDRTKLLLPCYRGMDPYDLPEALSVLQSYDMSKIGFIQDLTRGVNKVLDAGRPKEPVRETVVVQQQGSGGAAPLVKRAFMFLEDGDFARADEFCEKVLNLDPENAEAYLGKLMAELGVKTRDGLKDVAQPFDDRNNYKKALRFGDTKLKAKLSGDIAFIKERNETARKNGIYNTAVRAMNTAATESAYKSAAATFRTIPGFKDADDLAERCLEQAEAARKNAILQAARATGKKMVAYPSDYESAINLLRTIPGWKDADDLILVYQRKIEEIKAQEEAKRKEAERKAEEQRLAEKEQAKLVRIAWAIVLSVIVLCIAAAALFFFVIEPNQRYNAAKALYDEGKYVEAINAFQEMNGYRDSEAQIEACKTAIKDREYDSAVALMEKGSYDDAITAFTALNGYRDSKAQIDACINAKRAARYDDAVALMEAGNYEEAIKTFETLIGYRDSEEQITGCQYAIAVELYNAGQYEEAIAAFEALNGYNESEEKITACQYAIAEELYNAGKYEESITAFDAIAGYKDSAEQIEKCKAAIKDRDYAAAVALMETGEYEEAITAFETLNGYKDSEARIETCRDAAYGSGYDVAVEMYNAGKYVEAITAFTALNGYKDSEDLRAACWDNVAVRETIAAGASHSVGLRTDGTVASIGSNDEGQRKCNGWNGIISVAARSFHTVGLRSDGTVVATGANYYGQCDVSGWTNIVAIAAGDRYTIGLRSDSTVVAVGWNGYGQCDVSGWTNIVAIAAGSNHTVGLRSDGTLVATGSNSDGQCDVSDWSDIVAIAAGDYHTVGLKSNGTVVAVGSNTSGRFSVAGWKDIVAIAAGYSYTVGLKSNGTVVAAGANNNGQCNVSGWKKIVAIAVGTSHTVGLKSDGTVVAVGYNQSGQCDVSYWKDIKVPEE